MNFAGTLFFCEKIFRGKEGGFTVQNLIGVKFCFAARRGKFSNETSIFTRNDFDREILWAGRFRRRSRAIEIALPAFRFLYRRNGSLRAFQLLRNA